MVKIPHMSKFWPTFVPIDFKYIWSLNVKLQFWSKCTTTTAGHCMYIFATDAAAASICGDCGWTVGVQNWNFMLQCLVNKICCVMCACDCPVYGQLCETFIINVWCWGWNREVLSEKVKYIRWWCTTNCTYT